VAAADEQTMTANSPITASRSPGVAAFIIADALFLALVGATGAGIMFLVHLGGWHFAAAMALGMIAAMVVQMLMAFAAAPVLGSIEIMVPAMLVGMIAPMLVCAGHLTGHDWNWTGACLAGAITGAAILLFLLMYGMRCRSRFHQYSTERR
jgi:hypothetical protein